MREVRKEIEMKGPGGRSREKKKMKKKKKKEREKEEIKVGVYPFMLCRLVYAKSVRVQFKPRHTFVYSVGAILRPALTYNST